MLELVYREGSPRQAAERLGMTPNAAYQALLNAHKTWRRSSVAERVEKLFAATPTRTPEASARGA